MVCRKMRFAFCSNGDTSGGQIMPGKKGARACLCSSSLSRCQGSNPSETVVMRSTRRSYGTTTKVHDGRILTPLLKLYSIDIGRHYRSLCLSAEGSRTCTNDRDTHGIERRMATGIALLRLAEPKSA